MSNLSLSELKKVNKKTGESRVNILKRKILNNEYLETVDNRWFKITNKDFVIKQLDNIENIKKLYLEGIFNDNLSGIYLSNILLKSKDFGGQCGGRGGGYEYTFHVESFTAILFSLVQNILKRKLTHNDITKDNVNKSLNLVYLYNKNLLNFDILNSFDKSLIESIVYTCNLIWEYIDNDDEYLIFRKDNFMNLIYNIFNLCKTSLKNDRWNPGDIWLVRKSKYSYYNNILNNKSWCIKDLNNLLIYAFNEKDIIPVSLKKANQKSKISIYNSNAFNMCYILNMHTGRKDLFNTKSCYIEYIQNSNKYEAISRTKQSNGRGFSLMLKDKMAFGGSIGEKKIIEIIKMYSDISLIPKNEINIHNDLFLNEISKLYLNINDNLKYKTYKQFKRDVIEKFNEGKINYDWLISKYFGLVILNGLKQNNKNALLTSLIKLIKSQDDLSSIFLKIENE